MKKFKIEVDGEEYVVNVEEIGSESSSLVGNGVQRKGQNIDSKPAQLKKTKITPEFEESEMAPSPDVGEGDVLAPMPGNVLEINVKNGESVEKGDVVAVLEAMKMENDISTDISGTVKEIKVRVGDSVDAEDVLMVIE